MIVHERFDVSGDCAYRLPLTTTHIYAENGSSSAPSTGELHGALRVSIDTRCHDWRKFWLKGVFLDGDGLEIYSARSIMSCS